MMLIYMRHDRHGIMPVYSERVKQENLANGWRIIDWPPADVARHEEPAEEPRRRGRPPKVSRGDG